MATVAGFAAYRLEMTKTGQVAYPAQRDALLAAIGAGATAPTDLLVLSHGWNNDMAEAEALYATLLANLAAALGSQPQRRIAVLQLFWPSKKFADSDLIPAVGEPRLGAATAAGSDLGADALKKRLDQLKGVFDNEDETPLEAAKALVDALEDSPQARRDFVQRLRELVEAESTDPLDAEDDGSDRFLNRPGDDLLARLRPPLMIKDRPRAGGGATSMGAGASQRSSADSAGAAVGLGSAFSGMKAAAWRLLNYATYYQMKKRAGLVGANVNAVLAAVRDLRPDIRLHMIGHSFGARLVTAAIDGARPFTPSSLVLLQGAYSHHGLTAGFKPGQNGFFHAVVTQGKVDGPIAITHTANDKAVGVAYAIASRISGDNRSAVGDANDEFGGIGRNGAVKLPAGKTAAATLGGPGTSYQLAPGKVTNLRSDGFISGHSDVANPAVASLIKAAIS